MYLGDGYVARRRKTYALRIFLNRKQTAVIARVDAAIKTLMPPGRVGRVQRREALVTEVTCYSPHWPAIFPQHGPGRKHHRRIALEIWQSKIVIAYPAEFLRGLLESDGCRHRRLVRGRDYPAYSFSNRSEDILGLFTWACDLMGMRWRRASRHHISIARRPDVARLDALFAAVAQTPSVIPSSLRNTSTPGA